MIIYLEGTVFNAPVKTFVNTVNCAGVMGAGIALEFKLRYPQMYEDYVEKCNNKQIKVGRPRIYEYSDEIWVLNFPTKAHWRFPSKIQWIEQGLKYFSENYKKIDIKSIAFPKLGTNNGGLDWNEVKVLMEKYLGNLEMPVYICLDEKNEAEGIEKIMLDGLNAFSLSNLIQEIGIPKKQAEKIVDKLPFERFWHVSKIEGIGDKTYERLFSYFYNKSGNNNKINDTSDSGSQHAVYEQMKLI